MIFIKFDNFHKAKYDVSESSSDFLNEDKLSVNYSQTWWQLLITINLKTYVTFIHTFVYTLEYNTRIRLHRLCQYEVYNCISDEQ